MTQHPRSPNYPRVDLASAIQLATDLYSSVGKGQFAPIDAAQAWGSKSATGPVRMKIGALRQYGLIEGRSRGRNAENPRLSMRGLTLILSESDSSEYEAAVREASIAPPLFYELGQSHPDAADGVLRQYLIIQKNFTDEGADRFIGVYKSTIDLVSKLDLVNTYVEPEDDYAEDDHYEEIEKATELEQSGAHIAVSVSADVLTVPLPRNGFVHLPSSMTAPEWKQMETILSAYKPMIVTDVTESQDSLGDD